MCPPLYAIRLIFDCLSPGYTTQEIRYLTDPTCTTYTTNNLEEIKCVFKGLLAHVEFTKEINNCLYKLSKEKEELIKTIVKKYEQLNLFKPYRAGPFTNYSTSEFTVLDKPFYAAWYDFYDDDILRKAEIVLYVDDYSEDNEFSYRF